MTNILLDTNIILDIALKRQPFFESSAKIFMMMDQHVIHEALQREMKDFEDAIQVSAADLRDIKIIVTRNPRDFNNCGLEVYTPDELIETIGE